MILTPNHGTIRCAVQETRDAHPDQKYRPERLDGSGKTDDVELIEQEQHPDRYDEQAGRQLPVRFVPSVECHMRHPLMPLTLRTANQRSQRFSADGGRIPAKRRHEARVRLRNGHPGLGHETR
jgi:hypothetical protein